MASLLLRSEVDNLINMLKANECVVDDNKETGTVTAIDPDVEEKDVTVFMAIQKYHNGPFICRFTNSERVRWGSKQEG